MKMGNKELKEFFRWYFSHAGLLTKFPQNPLKMLKNSTELILYRDGQNQVELITLREGAVIPPHRHPNIDTYEVPTCGRGSVATVDGRTTDTEKALRTHIVPLPRNVLHSATIGAEDAAFISVQRWKDGVTPTFITDDWVGPQWN